MKTQLSRKLYRPEKRYSAVFQQMGRMLTDADSNDAAELIRERQNDALTDVIGSGTPRDRGLVNVQSNPDGTTTYTLQWGYAYVDGIIAQVRPADPSVAAFDYLAQADFPGAPALPAGDHRLYLDVWERPVTALEDEALRDPGLHGADTCTRTQTMAQVKWCPVAVDPADPAQNPQLGDALMSLQLRQGSTSPDPCDPCADEIELHDDVGNYLFRVEAHAVEYAASGSPERLLLKWSSENGGEQYLADDVPPGFAGENWIYEFFSGQAEQFASEKHPGKHLSTGFSPVRGRLETGFPDVIPAGTSLVRRWDGFCELRKNGASWELVAGNDRGVDLSTALAAAAHGRVVEGAVIAINANAMNISADLADNQLLAGDYWCHEVRQSVHSSGDLLLDAELPAGIRHHYLSLGTVIGGELTVDDRGGCQAFGFPSLGDLNAGDVCYTIPDCGTTALPTVSTLLEETMGDALPDPGEAGARVSQVLDALMCQHAATTLPVVKNEALCPPLQDPSVRTVQDALNTLCERGVSGCATFTVLPRPGWEAVFDQIPPGGDASICFREGDYAVDAEIEISGKGHLKISGAGPGTKITARRGETALKFDNCTSVAIASLAVSANATGNSGAMKNLGGALHFENCRDVDVSHAALRCAAGTRPAATCMTIRHTGSRSGNARVQGCSFDVGHRQVGLLVLSVERATISDNTLNTRPKPRSMTLDQQLLDRSVAASVRKLLINQAVVRNFEAPATRGRLNIQMENNSQRRIMIESPVAASAWKGVLAGELGDERLASNQALLNHARAVATRLVVEPQFRSRFSAFARWFDTLRLQNPAVAFKGIVCGGRVARDIRISNNTLSGVQEGIHVGVSDRTASAPRSAGRLLIESNTVSVLLPPIMAHRRGGIFVGNCNHATVSDNHVSVQRFQASRNAPVEGVRVYGRLGRMLKVRENYMSNCSVGVRVQPTNSSAGFQNQWQVKDNMMPGANPRVRAPSTVQQINNRG